MSHFVKNAGRSGLIRGLTVVVTRLVMAAMGGAPLHLGAHIRFLSHPRVEIPQDS